MSIRFGVSPIAWSNDDLPELGADISLEQCLIEASGAGYEGIELGSKFPRQPDKLAELLEKHGLRCTSGWYGCRLLERSANEECSLLQPHLELLSANGCDVVVIADVSGSVHSNRASALADRPRLSARQWETVATGLNHLGSVCRKYGLYLAYHAHMGTVIQTEGELHELLERTEDEKVGLTFDTGHVAFSGADPEKLISEVVARVRHVHCKDVRRDVLAGIPESCSFLDAVVKGVFTVPSDGSLDFERIAHLLVEGGYKNGWVVVEAEQDPKVANPLKYARIGYQTMHKAFSQKARVARDECA